MLVSVKSLCPEKLHMISSDFMIDPKAIIAIETDHFPTQARVQLILSNGHSLAVVFENDPTGKRPDVSAFVDNLRNAVNSE